MLEEEALPYSIAHEQASEHAPQEDMAVELSQDQAAEEPLDTVNESGEANEHGKYSGIIALLRDNPTEKVGFSGSAPQEHPVLEPPQAGAEEPPLHPLEMSDNSLIIALENGKNVISDDEKDQEEQV
ncbi:hypothetical protein R6Z07F_011399 [Ovis aries]